MGGYVSKFQALIWAKKETRILILGLVSAPQCERQKTRANQYEQDNAGKTTLLYRLKACSVRHLARPKLR
jgi:ADP-ribosylation factor-like protein 1